MNVNVDRYARELAGARPHVPVEIVPGRKRPKLLGSGYYWTTPGGKLINHPNAYKWPKVYNASTRRVEVGALTWPVLTREAERKAAVERHKAAQAKRRQAKKLARAERLIMNAHYTVEELAKLAMRAGACSDGAHAAIRALCPDGARWCEVIMMATAPVADIADALSVLDVSRVRTLTRWVGNLNTEREIRDWARAIRQAFADL